MKHVITLIALLFYVTNIFSQFDEKPSIVIHPPFLSVSPIGVRSNPVEINGYDNIFLGIDFGEAYITTNPRDPLNSICAFNTNGLYYTIDGFNWIRNTPQFPGYSILGDPVMTFDSLGNCIYATLYQNGPTYGTVVMKTTNKGLNWIGPYNVYSTTVGLVDKEWIAADHTGGPYSNNLYLGWRQYGTTGMRFVRSTNGGVNWSAPLTIPGTQNAYITVGPNGDIQGGSVYYSATNNNSIVVTRSTDGGETFLPQVTAAVVDPPGLPCAGRRTVKNCIRMNHIPSFAVDNGYSQTRGNIYGVYCGNPVGPDNCDIFLIRSTDYGLTWSEGLRVNDDNTITDQWLPSITVDKHSGKIFVSWYDSRVDPAANILTRIYGAVSTNGGLSFLPNDNISDVSFDPNAMALSLPGGEKYIGDYYGNSAIGNTSYNVWADGRNNNLGSYVGFYPDFAMTVNPVQRSINNGDSTSYSIKIPTIKGTFSEVITFTAQIDTLPLSGTIQISFENDKDSISSIPDSVTLKIRTSGNVTKGIY
ncbi:MAG: sialidase family protein, partial [Saprospiraceae bacterium]